MNEKKNKIHLRTDSMTKIHCDNIFSNERPISDTYPAIDTDLARDNLENHLSAADLQDL